MVSPDVPDTYAIRLTCPILHIQPKLGEVGQGKDPSSKAADSRPQLSELIKRGSGRDTFKGLGNYKFMTLPYAPPRPLQTALPFVLIRQPGIDKAASRTLGCVS